MQIWLFTICTPTPSSASVRNSIQIQLAQVEEGGGEHTFTLPSRQNLDFKILNRKMVQIKECIHIWFLVNCTITSRQIQALKKSKSDRTREVKWLCPKPPQVHMLRPHLELVAGALILHCVLENAVSLLCHPLSNVQCPMSPLSNACISRAPSPTTCTRATQAASASIYRTRWLSPAGQNRRRLCRTENK